VCYPSLKVFGTSLTVAGISRPTSSSTPSGPERQSGAFPSAACRPSIVGVLRPAGARLVVMAEPTTTTRRPARCSKHAFAPRASCRPRNDVAHNVTLPAHRHQTCLGRAGLASETAGAGDDPVNPKGGPDGLLAPSLLGPPRLTDAFGAAALQNPYNPRILGALLNPSSRTECAGVHGQVQARDDLWTRHQWLIGSGPLRWGS
jgi:hypothetical protein